MMQTEPLLTDLYQFTMAQAVWQHGKDQTEASYYAHFRKNPFKGGYALACGASSVVEFVEGFSFDASDLEYLESLLTADGTKLFDHAFLETLTSWQLTVDIDCMPEGTVAFAQEPLFRVKGPLAQCLLLETPLLNLIGFQTLVATKAARICNVTDKPVAEFGLRRAQGPNGGTLASRSAYVGGCASTSNVLAGKLYDIPVSGTHSHAWVMSFENELDAFRAYAESFPHNAVLLVDTYNTLEGVGHAITVAKEMEERGQRLAGIRIDSGDLAWLSKRARELLDAAGLAYVKITASNDLDEHTIFSLEYEQNACVDLWGVGTHLATAFDQPALGMVYKLSALKDKDASAYKTVLKVSEQAAKATLPGILTARRYFDSEGFAMGDMVYDELMPPAQHTITDPFDSYRQKDLSAFTSEELLVPLVRKGQSVGKQPTATEARANALRNLATIPDYNRRLLNPHSYPVGLEGQLLAKRDQLLRRPH